MFEFEGVRVKNFRSLRDAQVSWKTNLFLLGPNASGKTNILEAIRLFFTDKWPKESQSDETCEVTCFFGGPNLLLDEGSPGDSVSYQIQRLKIDFLFGALGIGDFITVKGSRAISSNRDRIAFVVDRTDGLQTDGRFYQPMILMGSAKDSIAYHRKKGKLYQSQYFPEIAEYYDIAVKPLDKYLEDNELMEIDVADDLCFLFGPLLALLGVRDIDRDYRVRGNLYFGGEPDEAPESQEVIGDRFLVDIDLSTFLDTRETTLKLIRNECSKVEIQDRKLLDKTLKVLLQGIGVAITRSPSFDGFRSEYFIRKKAIEELEDRRAAASVIKRAAERGSAFASDLYNSMGEDIHGPSLLLPYEMTGETDDIDPSDRPFYFMGATREHDYSSEIITAVEERIGVWQDAINKFVEATGGDFDITEYLPQSTIAIEPRAYLRNLKKIPKIVVAPYIDEIHRSANIWIQAFLSESLELFVQASNDFDHVDILVKDFDATDPLDIENVSSAVRRWANLALRFATGAFIARTELYRNECGWLGIIRLVGEEDEFEDMTGFDPVVLDYFAVGDFSNLESSVSLFSSARFRNKYLSSKLPVALIDEPEMHTHPKLQREIVKNIEEKVLDRATFIFATHSMDFLNMDYKKADFVMLKKEKGESKFYPLDAGNESQLRQACDYLGISRGELLLIHSFLLLVEGEYDKVFIEELFGEKLARNRIMIIPFRGFDKKSKARNLKVTIEVLNRICRTPVGIMSDNTRQEVAESLMDPSRRGSILEVQEGQDAKGVQVEEPLKYEELQLARLVRYIEEVCEGVSVPYLFGLSRADICRYIPTDIVREAYDCPQFPGWDEAYKLFKKKHPDKGSEYFKNEFCNKEYGFYVDVDFMQAMGQEIRERGYSTADLEEIIDEIIKLTKLIVANL